jgi:xanthine dehydrogenase large subunit
MKSIQPEAVFHESASEQIAGRAIYIDDMSEVAGTVHAAAILSRHAHAHITHIDDAQALALDGVIGTLDQRDVVGDPMIASFSHDEAIFASDHVHYVGHPVGLVIAQSHRLARQAAQRVQLQVKELAHVLDVREAYRQQSWVLPPVKVERGQADEQLRQSPHTLTGTFECGGQEHFYFETQIAYALPQENNQWLIYSSTQHPGEVQHWVAHALGVPLHCVRIVCRRMGGGFGGKETQSGHLAVWAALAANKFKRPVKMRLDRDEDFQITGKRHPFVYDYQVGFNDQGRIQSLIVQHLVDCGYSADLSGPVADRAIFHTDNAYFLEHVRIESYRCKTNKQSQTAFRGFGGPQGMIVTEVLIGEIARHLGLDPLAVRMANLYGTSSRNTTHYGMQVKDNILQPLIDRLASQSHYQQRRAAAAQWNKTHPYLRKGIALTPVKFGISFTATQFNQAGALVHIYTDGSILVHHGGTEMGQGLHTKVQIIVADTLGVHLQRVKINASDTSHIPNASATAASSGTDLNGRAAEFAALEIKQRLREFVASQSQCSLDEVTFSHDQVHTPNRQWRFEEVIEQAYAQRIQLWSDGFYKTPDIHYNKATLSGQPFYYFAYGAACSEVAIDTLTGEYKVLRVDILHDVGHAVHQAIDIGQIEGGFIQGMGWLTTEELVWSDQGKLLTHAPSTYKIPTLADIPLHFNVQLWDQPNPVPNVKSSKAVGEPPFMLAISVLEALRDAVAQHTQQASVKLHAPATPERVFFSLQ